MTMARPDDGDTSDATGAVIIVVVLIVVLAIGVLTVGGSSTFVRDLVTNETRTATPTH
jgi:hypothetical protein